MTALLKSQENIAAHDNGDMADDTIKIPQLGLPLKVEVVFHHLEKYLDIPIGAVVVAQYPLTLLVSQYVHESNHHRHQAQQKLPSVIPGILQDLAGAVLLESHLRIVDDAPGKVYPTKRQGEDGGEHG